MHHLGAAAGHLEKLVVADLLEFPGLGHDAGVTGVDSVDVGENLAEVGIDRGGHGDRREVRATATQGRDAAIRAAALEPGEDDDVPVVEQAVHFVRGDVGDASLGVNPVGHDPGLRAGEGYGLAAHRIDRHRRERDRGLFAGGEEDVHLALGGGVPLAGDLVRQLDQSIRHPGHGRNHGDDLVPLGTALEDALRHVANALRAAHGGTTVFLDDEAHDRMDDCRKGNPEIRVKLSPGGAEIHAGGTNAARWRKVERRQRATDRGRAQPHGVPTRSARRASSE